MNKADNIAWGKNKADNIVKNWTISRMQGRIDKSAKRIKELEAALDKLTTTAERCDSWESFPQDALDSAYHVLYDKKGLAAA